VAILFLSVIVVGLLRPNKKEAEEKWHSIFCWIGLMFVSAFTLFFAGAVSFVVDATLGWKLSFLAGASVILGAFSLVAGFIVSFKKVSIKHLFLWGFLGMASFVSFLTLSLSSSFC